LGGVELEAFKDAYSEINQISELISNNIEDFNFLKEVN